MKKQTNLKNKLALMLATLLIVNGTGLSVFGEDVLEAPINATTTVTLSQDKQTAVIDIEASAIGEGVTVEGIESYENPPGANVTPAEQTTPGSGKFTVERNGTYTFKVLYTEETSTPLNMGTVPTIPNVPVTLPELEENQPVVELPETELPKEDNQEGTDSENTGSENVDSEEPKEETTENETIENDQNNNEDIVNNENITDNNENQTVTENQENTTIDTSEEITVTRSFIRETNPTEVVQDGVTTDTPNDTVDTTTEINEENSNTENSNVGISTPNETEEINPVQDFTSYSPSTLELTLKEYTVEVTVEGLLEGKVGVLNIPDQTLRIKIAYEAGIITPQDLNKFIYSPYTEITNREDKNPLAEGETLFPGGCNLYTTDLEKIQKITAIEKPAFGGLMSLEPMADFTGIEYLSNMEIFEEIGHTATSIDVSTLTKLKTLQIPSVAGFIDGTEAGISAIDLTGLTSLTTVDLSNNSLSSLIIPEGAALETLKVASNRLNYISIPESSKNSLNTLVFDHNRLKFVNLEGFNIRGEANVIQLGNKSGYSTVIEDDKVKHVIDFNDFFNHKEAFADKLTTGRNSDGNEFLFRLIVKGEDEKGDKEIEITFDAAGNATAKAGDEGFINAAYDASTQKIVFTIEHQSFNIKYMHIEYFYNTMAKTSTNEDVKIASRVELNFEEKNEYKIDFEIDPNNNFGTLDGYTTVMIKEGNKIGNNVPTVTVTAENKNFVGWKIKDSNGGLSEKTLTTDQVKEITPNSNTTYVAVFEDKAVAKSDINFVINEKDKDKGSITEGSNFEVENGETLGTNVPTVEVSNDKVYELEGWVKLDKDGNPTGEVIKPEDLGKETVSEDVTYEAVFKTKAYDVTFKISEKDDNGTLNGTEDKTVTTKVEGGKTPKAPSVNVNNDKTHEFKGWQAQDENGNPIGNVISSEEIKNQKVYENVTYVAVFEQVANEVNFVIMDPDKDKVNNFTSDPSFVKIGELVKDVPSVDVKSEYEKTHKFIGWKIDGNEDNKVYTEAEVKALKLNEKTTFVAAFEAKSYTLNFEIKSDDNGKGSLVGEASHNVVAGGILGFNTPTIDQDELQSKTQTFLGWAPKLSDGTLGATKTVEELEDEAIFGDATYVAVFEAIKYQVKFEMSDDAKYGSINGNSKLDINAETPIGNSVPTIEILESFKDKQEFEGWIIKGGDGQILSQEDIAKYVVQGEVIFVAKFKEVNNGNGGSSKPDPKPETKPDPKPDPKPETKPETVPDTTPENPGIIAPINPVVPVNPTTPVPPTTPTSPTPNNNAVNNEVGTVAPLVIGGDTAQGTGIIDEDGERVIVEQLQVTDDVQQPEFGDDVQHPAFGGDGHFCILHWLILLATILIGVVALVKRRNNKKEEEELEAMLEDKKGVA